MSSAFLLALEIASRRDRLVRAIPLAYKARKRRLRKAPAAPVSARGQKAVSSEGSLSVSDCKRSLPCRALQIAAWLLLEVLQRLAIGQMAFNRLMLQRYFFP